jgi:N-acyl-D-amino-acid deacylase
MNRLCSIFTAALLTLPFQVGAESLQLTLPPAWHGVVGVPMSLYYDNVVLTENSEAYEFTVDCPLGKAGEKEWTVMATGADIGAHPLKVTVKDKLGKVIETAQTTLHISPSAAGEGKAKRLLIVGDSLTSASVYANELSRLFATPGNPKVSFLGTHRPASVKMGVAHEGYGGWKWVDFLTKYAPKGPEVTAGPLARKTTSPFVFANAEGKGTFDLPRYIWEHCEGNPPDVVTFLLGINDCFGANPEDPKAIDARINEVLNHADNLLTEFRQAMPKAVLAVGLTPPPNAREAGFVASYKGKYHRWGWKRIQHRLVQRMIARLGGKEHLGIHLVATELNIDPVSGYPENNGVHPNAIGYAQIGTSFFGWMKAWLNEPEKDYDLIIRNARIVDGTGGPERAGSIGILNGRIVALGEVAGTAKQEMDANGRVAAPGFVDVHTHSEMISSIPAVENFLRMGVTSIVTGNCGFSRTDVAGFFRELEETGISLHVATLIGHGAVREEGMGGRFIRAPNAVQLEKMKGLVDQGMKDGAVGLSTGLIYVPGTFAKTDEIIALAKIVSGYDGVYASHMRHETTRIFGAMDELITIAREANIRAELSHIKLSGPTAWGRAGEVLARLDKARAEGLRITHDQYAYTASSTGLRQVIPDAALEGTREDYIARIEDPAKKAEIIKGMRERLVHGGHKDYAYAVVARFRDDPTLNGLTIPQAAKKVRGSDSLEDQIELILDIERRGGGSGIYHSMNEEDLTVFLKHPLTMIASDGGPRRLGEDVPHPRSYGNNARVLARYVREQKVLSLEEAIRRMASLPAQTFGLKNRGELKVGAWADVVIFDPEKVRDVSTFEDPHQYSEGFSDVLVDGVPVIHDRKLTATRPGGPLRK